MSDRAPRSVSPGVTRSMRANRSRDTKPELALRKILHSRGLRYRVDHAPIHGVRRRADVVFTRLRIAVFVDGCFWHGCPEHATVPKSNADYWVPKLQRNIERDRETDAVLMSQGWSVLRIWEHVPSAEAADRVAAEAVRRRLENDGD
ncbi:very short patch repair endonuclease [Rathayibacter caricis]|uniref:very short patch repair endonuclease n=1 Tax=Rathayibacter caricis TaxID=110936 RepID=UPI001FB38134|nr:very short patch repair endonuclease [Rathayibacter caricis]MCJ1696094.1 very short patch repair endonuclease [Rathayibacter caricis]